MWRRNYWLESYPFIVIRNHQTYWGGGLGGIATVSHFRLVFQNPLFPFSPGFLFVLGEITFAKMASKELKCLFRPWFWYFCQCQCTCQDTTFVVIHAWQFCMFFSIYSKFCIENISNEIHISNVYVKTHLLMYDMGVFSTTFFQPRKVDREQSVSQD